MCVRSSAISLRAIGVGQASPYSQMPAHMPTTRRTAAPGAAPPTQSPEILARTELETGGGLALVLEQVHVAWGASTAETSVLAAVHRIESQPGMSLAPGPSRTFVLHLCGRELARSLPALRSVGRARGCTQGNDWLLLGALAAGPARARTSARSEATRLAVRTVVCRPMSRRVCEATIPTSFAVCPSCHASVLSLFPLPRRYGDSTRLCSACTSNRSAEARWLAGETTSQTSPSPNFQRSEQELISIAGRSAPVSVYIAVKRSPSKSNARCCRGVGCVSAVKAA
jgi:hypothetical protein